MSVCPFVCLSTRISQNTRPLFTKYSLHVTYDGGSVLLGRECNRFIVSVLRIKSCFHIIQRKARNKDDAYVSSSSPDGDTGAKSVVFNCILFLMKSRVTVVFA